MDKSNLYKKWDIVLLCLDDWVEPIGKDRKKKEDPDGCEIFMLLLLKEIEELRHLQSAQIIKSLNFDYFVSMRTCKLSRGTRVCGFSKNWRQT